MRSSLSPLGRRLDGPIEGGTDGPTTSAIKRALDTVDQPFFRREKFKKIRKFGPSLATHAEALKLHMWIPLNVFDAPTLSELSYLVTWRSYGSQVIHQCWGPLTECWATVAHFPSLRSTSIHSEGFSMAPRCDTADSQGAIALQRSALRRGL